MKQPLADTEASQRDLRPLTSASLFIKKWRKLSACRFATSRELEAYATSHRLEAYAT